MRSEASPKIPTEKKSFHMKSSSSIFGLTEMKAEGTVPAAGSGEGTALARWGVAMALAQQQWQGCVVALNVEMHWGGTQEAQQWNACTIDRTRELLQASPEAWIDFSTLGKAILSSCIKIE